MEASILTSTKKVLNVPASLDVFDLDIMTHINAAFSVLAQLGVGPIDGYMIEDVNDVWTDFDCPRDQLNMVRSYIFLKVRLLFDPPATSFHLTAAENQLAQFEWRLNMARESKLPVIVEVIEL